MSRKKSAFIALAGLGSSMNGLLLQQPVGPVDDIHEWAACKVHCPDMMIQLWSLKEGISGNSRASKLQSRSWSASLIFTLKLRREIFVLGMTDRHLT